ncbi:MAG: hypothetical protein JJU45_16055 [Acidimicrobiia bacterium]|nr:hypothetical protein [Acidimicrobiia bacterium]
MERRQVLAVGALSAWTLFVWGQRLVNLATGDESGPSAVVSVVLSGVLSGLAVAAAVALVTCWRGGGSMTAGWRRTVVQVFAGLTVAVWAVRGTAIVVDWRSPGFVAVHVVLAVVSVTLAVAAWRSVTATRQVATVG